MLRKSFPSQAGEGEEDKEEIAFWEDGSFVSDYGDPISRRFGPDDYDHHRDHEDEDDDVVDPVLDSRLERKIDGNASDSDSSLDLHTPLPCVVVSSSS